MSLCEAGSDKPSDIETYLRDFYGVSNLRQEFMLGSCFDFSNVLHLMTGWPVWSSTVGIEAANIRIHSIVKAPNFSKKFVDANGYTDQDVIIARTGFHRGNLKYNMLQKADPEPQTDVDTNRLAEYILTIPRPPFSEMAFRNLALKRMPHLYRTPRSNLR